MGMNRPPQGTMPMPPFDAKTPSNTPKIEIVAEKTPQKSDSDDDAPLKELVMTDLIALVEKSVVRIIVRSEVGASVGSGFVIDTAGLIMTNYHVIEGAKSAFVEFETGKKATVTGFTTIDKERDLAIIKIDVDSKELQRIRIAKELPKKGEKVAAFGAPRGLSFTASDGIISAIRHTPEFNARTEGSYLQTTAPISPGNSGGPLVNMRGEVVGVNSFKIEGENLNFAASSNDIRDVIANKGDTVTPLSPEALPTKYTDKAAGRAEDLSGTTKGRMLLAQIRDVAIVMLPFTFDPSGRFSDYVEDQVGDKLTKGCGWKKVMRQSQFKNSTAVVIVLIYFRVAENIEKADEKGVSELMCRIRIVARDVDKDGEAYAAIVWSEDSPLGTVSLSSLATGLVTDTMKKKIGEFFNKLVSASKKAKRDAENGKLDK
jgi:hypothetical protein